MVYIQWLLLMWLVWNGLYPIIVINVVGAKPFAARRLRLGRSYKLLPYLISAKILYLLYTKDNITYLLCEVVKSILDKNLTLARRWQVEVFINQIQRDHKVF